METKKKQQQQRGGGKQIKESSILKYLPRAASAAVVNFQNPIFSPGRDKRSSYHHHHNNSSSSSISFSGPLFPMINPDEIMRRKPQRKGGRDDDEPTSPKVSCIGQIKMQKGMKKNKKMLMKDMKKKTKNTTVAADKVRYTEEEVKKNIKKHGSFSSSSKFLRFLGGGGRSGSSDSTVTSTTSKREQTLKSSSMHASYGGVISSQLNNNKPSGIPSLGHMKRFASGRQSLANFDWTAQIAPVNDNDQCRNYHSDEERIDSDDDDDDGEVIIPFSAPILVRRGGDGMLTTEPRKEVNLWKRRNFDSPPPVKV